MRRAAVAAAAAAAVWTTAALAGGRIVWTPAFALALALLWREKESGQTWRWTPLRVFLAALALYLSTFRWKGGDDIPASLLPFAILKHGTLTMNPVLDPWLSGKSQDFTVRFGATVLSVYPIVAGVLAVPLYVIPVLAGAPVSEQFLHNLSKVGGSLMTAASVAIFFSAARRRSEERWAAVLTLLYAAGSWSFSVSSQALWQHGPAQLGVAIGAWGVLGEGPLADFAAGLGFSLAAAARPDNVFLGLGGAAALLFTRPRALARAALGAAIPAALLAAYWLHYTGVLRPPESAFQANIMKGFQPEALAALMFSPSRGLLWFSPAALFGVWAAFRRGAPRTSPWLLSGVAATWIFFSFYGNWFGGMTFGTRYWASSCVVLYLLCADAEERLSRGSLGKLFAACGAVSVCVHALGAYLTWPGRFDYDFERAHAWDILVHPWFDLQSDQGSLKSWPAFGRRAAFMAVFFAGFALYRQFRRTQGQAK